MDRGLVLIAAASGRALAASARRGGYVPLVADGFGDQDTIAAAAAHIRVSFARPINGDRFITALQTLADSRNCVGIVCGSGFEDRADLLTTISQRWPLLGNNPETITRAKDPIRFAARCREAGIPHPETSLVPPPDLEGWLAKRIGGAGGWHIRSADKANKRDNDIYFQRRVDGEPVSALLLCDGRNVLVLGFSAQWTAPTPRHPFRYGGAARPAPIAEDVKKAMIAALRRLNSIMPLVGLNSADFVLDGDAFQLLEVNPRPGATFDLFEPEGSSLFALHLDACRGTLPASAPSYRTAMAGAIVYAQRDILAAPACDWPEWIADRPVPGSRIEAEQPLCSVFARAATMLEAKQLVEKRSAMVHRLLAEGVS
jgi:predicted ATP-grasp superfamily ATP-dependent carboligase